MRKRLIQWTVVVAVILLLSAMTTTATVYALPLLRFPILDVQPREGYLINCLYDEESGHQPFPVLWEHKPGTAYVVCLVR